MRTMLVTLLFFLAANTFAQERIYVSEITEYKEHATRESFKEFFKKRMDNRQAYKGKSYRYDIVHEDSLFIYYGILCITEQGREYVSHLYKTNRTHVKSLFPAYQSIEGYHIRRKAETYIPEIIWIEGGASYAYANIDISLDADTIKVVYDKYEKKDFLFKKSNHHLICFDKHDLTLLRIKELDKPQSTSGKKK